MTKGQHRDKNCPVKDCPICERIAEDRAGR